MFNRHNQTPPNADQGKPISEETAERIRAGTTGLLVGTTGSLVDGASAPLLVATLAAMPVAFILRQISRRDDQTPQRGAQYREAASKTGILIVVSTVTNILHDIVKIALAFT